MAKKKNFDYDKAIEDIERALKDIEDNNLNLTELTSQLKKAKELIQACKVELTAIEKEVNGILNT